MAKIKEKDRAIKLRQQGNSVNEIAQKLNTPKSTVSQWCRNILLNKKQIKRLIEKQKSGSYKGRIKFLERTRKRRIEEIKKLKKEGLKEIGRISKRDLFIAGIAMYWSEGYTYSGGDQVGFTNSDPKMILFMLRWFKEICKIPSERFSLQIKINKIHKSRIKKVEYYWSKLTQVPINQFNKSILIKSNAKKIYSNIDSHYGTLRITIHQGTQLRRKIYGWIEGLVKKNISQGSSVG